MDSPENQINEKELYDLKNSHITNKLKLRKKEIYQILSKKAMMTTDVVIDDKIFENLKKLDSASQLEEIKKIILSNNEDNAIKILTFIMQEVCPRRFSDKVKDGIKDGIIGQNIFRLYYESTNINVFSLCCSIMAHYCSEYFHFSTQLINEQGIKIIYNKLTKNYFDNINILSNCIIIYKRSLEHLIDLLKSNNRNKYNDVSYNSKKYLCDFVIWILCDKKLFSSFESDIWLCFFKLIELLKICESVPYQYKLDFTQGDGTMDTLFSYVMEQPIKNLEYYCEQYYLEMLIKISEDPNYTFPLTKDKINIFDVIKRLCGYLYLNNNSTQEERENFPTLEPFMLAYCFEILKNLALEVVKRKDILDLVYLLFNNYIATVRFNDLVPKAIMDLLITFAENLSKEPKLPEFIFSPQRNIINKCVRSYVRNDECYVRVNQFLINIFEYKNFEEIPNIITANLIKCIVNGLDSDFLELNSKSIYCLKKLIEIKNKKNYNIDLVRYFYENNTLEKVEKLVLNKNYKNISEEENADDLIEELKNMFKEDENK